MQTLTITLSDGDISFSESVKLKNQKSHVFADINSIKSELSKKIKEQKKINKTFKVGDPVRAYSRSQGYVNGEVLRIYGHESKIFYKDDWFYSDNRKITRININKMRINPNDFTNYPWDSEFKKTEAEIVAQNIMKILQRTGNEFRELSWEEYEKERKKDGNFSTLEKAWFNKVIVYCRTAEEAREFSKSWN